MSSFKGTWIGPLWNALWRVAILLFIGYVLYSIRSIIVMTLVAGTLAYALSFPADLLYRLWLNGSHKAGMWKLPLIGKLRMNNHVKRIWVVFICYVLLGIAIWAGFSKLKEPISEGFTSLQNNWGTYHETFKQWRSRTWDPFYTGIVPLEWRRQIKAYTDGQVQLDWTTNVIYPMKNILQSSTTLIAWVVEFILVPVLAFYFLIDGKRLKRDMFQLMPKRRSKLMARIFYETNTVMRSYLVSQAILCVLAGAITYLMLSLIGHYSHSSLPNYAAMLAIYAAITRAIPVLGPLIGGIPVVALAAASTQSVQLGLIVAVLFTLMHFIESKFIMPMIVGERINLHAVWVILSLLIGAEFFGLIGMFFAPPVTAIVRNVWRHYYLPRGSDKNDSHTDDAEEERMHVAL